MARDQTSIVIVGGGIGGLCLAAALTQRNIKWSLLERSQVLAPVGTGIARMPPAMRILDRLGLLDAVREKSVVVPATKRLLGNGRLVAEVAYPTVWGGGETRSIHRAVLQDILLSAATGGDILLDARVHNVEQDGGGVAVQFADSSVRGDLVIGADGVRSTVRKTLGHGEPRLLGQRVFRAHTPISGLVQCHTLYLGRRAALGAVPLAQGTYLFINEFRCNDEVSGPVAGRRERAMSLVDDISAADALPLIEHWPSDEQTHEDVTWEVSSDKHTWRDARIVLLGDAAHAMSPVLAVGAAMAMEDGWVMAEELARKAVLDDALGAYLVRRRQRVRHVQSASADITARARSGARVVDLESELRSAYGPLLSEP